MSAFVGVLTALMVSLVMSLFATAISLTDTPVSATLEKLSSPSVQVRRTPTSRRVTRTVSSWTYRPGLSRANPGTAWDSHRSVKSAIVIRRRHLTPRVCEEETVSLFCADVPAGLSSASARLGAWHPHEAETWHLPICPCPAPPSSPVAGTTLAAALRWTRSSGRARPRPGRIRSPLRRRRPHRLRLNQLYLRLTLAATRSLRSGARGMPSAPRSAPKTPRRG